MPIKEEIEQIISKLENLEQEKADIAEHITDTYAEAKSGSTAFLVDIEVRIDRGYSGSAQ